MPEFAVDSETAGARFDVALARVLGVSRAVAARLIDAGDATLDGAPASKSARVVEGARIEATAPPEGQGAPVAENIEVRTVYEDEWLIVVSKPAGLVVHPAPGHAGGTLVNALLDAGTSGLMIVAKEEEAFARLTEQMGAREVSRTYLALVEGTMDTDTATIDAPIGRSPKQRKKMAVVAGGKPAVTNLRVLDRYPETTYLEVSPHTGRTHQIRVHLSAAGHPVTGDPVYGASRKLAASLGLARPFLHAARLSFIHPITTARIELEDPLPEDLRAALEIARRDS
jgi:23S rRNA pseudouridine1911/1915/1917 synthase